VHCRIPRSQACFDMLRKWQIHAVRLHRDVLDDKSVIL
jgi:hypothetical protein